MATKAEIASAEERLSEHFIDREGVEKRKAFGSDALMVNGKMFVIFRKGSIIVKLPPEKGPKLVRAKEAKPFEPSPGRVMKRWFVFPAKVTDERRVEVAEMSFDYVVSEQERSD